MFSMIRFFSNAELGIHWEEQNNEYTNIEENVLILTLSYKIIL